MKSSVTKRSKSRVLKRSIVLAGHKTSVSLEDEFWNALKDIAAGRDETLSHLIAVIDADRQNAANLSSAIRLFVLGFYHDYYAKSHSRTRNQLIA
jgi:predicted DNA-binding ribbon-helix-helix protein